MQSNWLSSNYFSQTPAISRRKKKFITPEKSLCLSRQIIRKGLSVHHKSSFFFSWEVDCFSFKNGPNRNLYVEYSRTYGFSRMRGLGRFRNSQQAFAQGVKISRPFAFLAVRHMAICGKIVDILSVHKQFNVASAISNLKKLSLKVFLHLEQLIQNQRTFLSVDGDFIKSKRTKNTTKMLRYLLGLIYYRNTIFGN